MEKDKNRLAEVDGRLTTLVNKVAANHAKLEDKIANMEDRSRRDNIRVHGVPENAETSHVLAYLSDAITPGHSGNLTSWLAQLYVFSL